MLSLNNIKFMPMKKIAYVLFVCICLTGCTKCKEKNKEPITDYGVYTPPIVLGDYCCFKKNSYWVYQDSASGKIDCTYVTNAQVTTYTVNANSGKDYTGVFHYYNMYTKDGIGDERQYEVYDEDAAQSASCCGGRYYCEVHWNRPAGPIDSMGGSTPGVYFGSYTFMFNNFIDGTTGGSGIVGNFGSQCWSRGGSQITINSMTKEAKIFEILYKGDFMTNYTNYHSRNYVVKNIGVVKRIDLDSNRTWFLKRYSVSQ
jgi:hypothetical protein